MTREYALEVLDTILTIGDQVDALEMAIAALENENVLIDKVLEIIDKYDPIHDSGYITQGDRIRAGVLKLKGGEQE